MISDDDLLEYERLAAQATPGPWENDGNGVGRTLDRDPWHVIVVGTETVGSAYMQHDILVLLSDDAAFIAAARSAVPAMAEEIRRLRAIVADLAVADTVVHEHDADTKSGRDYCVLCISDGGFGSPVYHVRECPWRRADEAVKP